jgi:glucose/arabinose dehydrogenase
MIRAGGKIALAVALFLALLGGSARAASLQPIGSGFVAPVYVTSDPGDPERLFVVEQGGSIQLLENGELKPFANLSSVVVLEGEGGLLSIALAPDFHTSGRIFVYYTGKKAPLEVATSPPSIQVAELRASGSSAPLSTLRNLLTIPHPEQKNHYGGQLQFGPEGNLFISTGDGGGAGDPEENAQDLESLLGKILRLDPNPSGALPYTVPADNPFAASSAPYDTIWSYGLRNPFRFSFDRLGGDIWIGDVGQDSREEVDQAVAPGLGGGANYGWNCREGSLEETVPPEPGCASAAGFVDPVFEYANSAGFGNCAVIGGYVARGPGLADLYGRYVYGDLCVGELRSFSPEAPFATDRGEGLRVTGLTSFGEDACGRLYAVSREGSVYRLVGPGGPACPVAAPPPTPLAASMVGIRALRRKVVRNRRALITAWVAPCKGRQGEPVTLWRGRRKLGTRRLDRVCTARFRPRISRRSGFRATVKANETYIAAISRKLTVKPRPKPRHERRGR